jgi:hypothetical protein
VLSYLAKEAFPRFRGFRVPHEQCYASTHMWNRARKKIERPRISNMSRIQEIPKCLHFPIQQTQNSPSMPIHDAFPREAMFFFLGIHEFTKNMILDMTSFVPKAQTKSRRAYFMAEAYSLRIG